MRKGTALIAGVTGISGYNLANVLVASGWTVHGLARKPVVREGMVAVSGDLSNGPALEEALRGLPVTHAFFCTWTRRATERENVEANGAMMTNLLAALEDAPLDHLALVTGTKHYLGSFERTAAAGPRRRFAKATRASRVSISITRSRTSCPTRATGAASAGACIDRTRWSVVPTARMR